ncbi:MAG: FtsH protease activity modulator HflK [Desulfobulbaceae bacterium]|nr:FtsH protease activity modulator HflK [Desulfobulbaceae bacterium]
MPMNEQPPWGKKKKPNPTEDFLAQLIQKIRDFFDQQNMAQRNNQPSGDGDGPGQPPGQKQSPLKGGGMFFSLIVAALAIQVLFASFFTIAPGEVGIILRFGQYNRTTNPGLQFKVPYIEQLIKVDVETVRKEEFGFRSRGSATTSNIDRQGYDMESLMLTGDKNVIEMAWIVQYRVSDPVNFLFKVRDVPQAVRDASEMVVRRLVGNMDFDYVLGNRDTLAANARKELQAELNNLEAGVEVFTIQLQDINPPDPVRPAFNEVNEADQDMKRLVNEAEKTYNEVIPKARGSAKQIIEEARGYAIERVNRAQGEVARYLAILNEYKGSEQVTRQRLFLETMEETLPKVGHLYIMEGSQHPALPLINLSQRRTAEQKAATAPQTGETGQTGP